MLSWVALLAGSVLLTAAAIAGPADQRGGRARRIRVRLDQAGPARVGHVEAVDVYLYSYGMPDAMIVLHHVSYDGVAGTRR